MIRKRKYPLSLPLKRNQMEAVGHVAIQWAFLETEVDMAILEILDRLERAGRKVEKEERRMRRRFRLRANQLRELAREFFPSTAQADQLNNFLDTAMCLKPERDHIVHGRWRAKVTGDKLESNKIDATKYNFDARKIITRKDFPAPTMREIASKLSILNRDMFVFVMKNVGGVMPPSPGRYVIRGR